MLLTGSTGYIGAHIASNLLADYSQPMNLLVNAPEFYRKRRNGCGGRCSGMADFCSFEDFLNPEDQ